MKALLAPIFFSTLVAPVGALAAEALRGDHVRVSWLAPESFGRATERIAIRFAIDPEWHIYWKNPGDSGAAPKFDFSESRNRPGILHWPVPARIPVAHLTNLGYSREVAFPFDVTPGADAVYLKAKLEWLVCKEECIPGFGELQLRRPVRGEQARWEAAAFQKLKAVAVPGNPSLSPWKLARAVYESAELEVEIEGRGPAPDIFPVDGELVAPRAPAVVKVDRGYRFTFALNPATPTEGKTFRSGFVIGTSRAASEWHNVEIRPRQSTLPLASVDASLWLLLVSAFAGGVLLNLMPCVLPILSIKIVGFAHTPPEERRRDGVFYSLGVLTAFAALAGVFLALRFFGNAVGWGFQLQNPFVVLALIALFWLMGLNFLGVYEFGTSFVNAAGRSRQGGSFATGVLSVVIATPCTGPFMGSALGAAATLPWAAAFTIFLFLGAGLAFPYLAIATVPALSRALPRPGAWMERLRQFFAFPLFATVIWLLWVLQAQAGPTAAIWAAGILLTLAFSLWLHRGGGRVARPLAWIFALAVSLALASRIESENVVTPAATPATAWQPYTSARFAELRASGKDILLDFTASWCITCQVNKKLVLDTERGQEFFRTHAIELIRADWTLRDPAITQHLAGLGRNSVPVYAFYPKDGSGPRLLPQLLTFSALEELKKP